VSPLIHKTPSFKKLARHVSAIQHFICHYDLVSMTHYLCSTTFFAQNMTAVASGTPRHH
jgi:hypothetical protein